MDSLSEQVKAPTAEEIFAGGGDMGALMRSLDWSKTRLGPVENWPQSLRTAVSICLASHFPMLIWWGPELVKLYNDAYRPMLGATKHPMAMGQPGRECWPEIWDIIGPMLEGVLREGKATWSENQLLLLERNGYPEECYFTFSYSPIRDESGRIGGVFTAVTETTQQVLSERRLDTLRELAASAYEAQTAEDACRIAARVLEKNTADIPFALLYLLDSDGKQARLVGASGFVDGTLVSPPLINLSTLDEQDEVWPLAQAVHTGQVAFVTKVAELFEPEHLSVLPNYDDALHRVPTRQSALVLPITRPGEKEPYGLLVAGISPILQLNEHYQGFFTLVASQVAATVANVRAYQEARAQADALAELARIRREIATRAREHADRLQRLANASLIITATPMLDERLRRITGEARAIVGAHQAITSMNTDENWTHAITVVSFSEKYARWHDYIQLPPDSNVHALTLNASKPIRLTQAELEMHPAWQHLSQGAEKLPPLRGWLAAPLTGRDGQQLGMLQLSDKYEGEFTEEDETILLQLAQLASATIENARLYQNAQDAIRLRDELFTIVSHDLKNPVATIKGFAQLLKRMLNRMNLPDKVQQAQIVDGLSRIDLTATRMTTLINEMLDIAHLQIGKPLNLDQRETDLVRLAHQAVISYQQTTQRHRFHIEIGEPELVGWWDTVRLERVLGNLLSNAVKYSPEGGIITVKVMKEGDQWAVLSVEDQGVGIPADDLPHIFDRFHRAANIAGQIKGSGLGLASAHQIIKQHGGTITVTSQQGKGATFIVRLPLNPPDEGANA